MHSWHNRNNLISSQWLVDIESQIIKIFTELSWLTFWSSNLGTITADNFFLIFSFSKMSFSILNFLKSLKTHSLNSTSRLTLNSLQNLSKENKNYRTSIHSLSTWNLSYRSTSLVIISCYWLNKNMPNNNSINLSLLRSTKT